jgi:chemotaxis protein CheY-P-specific phosphatase CheC
MAEPLLTADELDQFGEFVNIAMGRAGADLAEAFAGFVHLKVPEIRSVTAATLDAIRARLTRTYTRISILHQEFIGELAGDIAVVYGPASYAVLREVLGFDERDGDGRRQREELLLELGNALSGTFVSGIADLLVLRTGLRPPRVALFDEPADMAARRLFEDSPAWQGETLQIAIVFHLEAHDLPFELLITLAPACLPTVQRALAAPR